MKTTPSVMQRVQAHIEAYALGDPFALVTLLPLGSRAAVDAALNRLTRTGTLLRVVRGVYVKPVHSRFVGPVMPSIESILAARCPSDIIAVSGAEAARCLALSTQVPIRPIFHTSGASCRLTMGNLVIQLNHQSQRKMALAGRPAGLALSALWYLGRHGVTQQTFSHLSHRLSPIEFALLCERTDLMPLWMRRIAQAYAASIHRPITASDLT